MQRVLNKRQKQLLDQTRERFVDERVCGYRTAADGVRKDFPPMDRAQAEQIWQNGLPKFENAMFDPEVIARFDLGKDEPIPAEWIKLIEKKKQ
jgi:hypothetical protein